MTDPVLYEINRTLGNLSGKVDQILTNQSDVFDRLQTQEAKHDALNNKFHKWGGIATAAIFLFTAFKDTIIPKG